MQMLSIYKIVWMQGGIASSRSVIRGAVRRCGTETRFRPGNVFPAREDARPPGHSQRRMPSLPYILRPAETGLFF